VILKLHRFHPRAENCFQVFMPGRALQ